MSMVRSSVSRPPALWADSVFGATWSPDSRRTTRRCPFAHLPEPRPQPVSQEPEPRCPPSVAPSADSLAHLGGTAGRVQRPHAPRRRDRAAPPDLWMARRRSKLQPLLSASMTTHGANQRFSIDANGCLTEAINVGDQKVVVHYDDIPESDITTVRGL